MDTTAIIIACIGGASGIITALTTAIFKILDYSKARKGEGVDARLKPLLQELSEQKAELHEIRLDTLRVQLMILMEHQPENHDTILKVAETYFLPPMNGNWVMKDLFLEWADREKVKVPFEVK